MSDLGVVHLIDDDDSFLRGMTRLLCSEGLSVRSFSAAIEFLVEATPATRGCIVSDLNMPEINGLELQVLAARRGATMPFVFLTGHGDIRTTVKAMRAGAADFLEKVPRARKLSQRSGQRSPVTRRTTDCACDERSWTADSRS
jgi:two-component system, LuxR family, response regulator FixJ